MGVDVARTKTIAFGLSCAMTGLGGALMGLFDKRAAVECISGSEGSPPFVLNRMDQGGAPTPVPTVQLQ